MKEENFNNTLQEIMDGEISKKNKEIIKQKEYEEEISKKIRLEKREIMKKIGEKFYKTFKVFFPNDFYNKDVRGKNYSIRCSKDFFIIFIHDSNIKTKYSA